ncbi:MAG: Hsp70 family protein [Hespellia sp.]|nr:Hsp70 family protein [Hespellia sp.]
MAMIGIDLGTTNSLAAVWQDGVSQLIPNSFGEYLTPSVVSLDEQGSVHVGKTAKERLISEPENTASVFKRFMGTEKTYCLRNRNYSPEELSSLVLKKLKDDAEIYLGEKVTEAIISVPAYFNNAQRDATKKAGELAGLKVDRIINEPSAAALACQHLYPEEESLEMVFDFGGGTLDVSIVDCFDNIINVLSISGDNHLGGCDFDLAMAQFFCKAYDMDYEQLSKTDQAAVIKSAETCKMELSESEHAEMTAFFAGDKKTLLFDTEKMIQASAGIFQRLLEPMRQAVRGAEVRWDDINGSFWLVAPAKCRQYDCIYSIF